MARGRQSSPVSENRRLRLKLCADVAETLHTTFFADDPLFDVGGLADALDHALPKLDKDYYDEVLEMEREKDEELAPEPKRTSIIEPLWLALGIEKRGKEHTLTWLFGALKDRLDELANVKHELIERCKEIAELREALLDELGEDAFEAKGFV